MRDTHQELLFGITGQVLVWEAPEGRPSSVTSVKVFAAQQNDDDEAEFEPTGTVEATPSTTIATVSGVDEDDQTKINLTAGTGVTAGRVYLLTSTLTEKERVAIVAITGSTAYARQPLLNSYAAGSTFQSTRITAPVDATWVADSNALSPEDCASPYYRVVWTYVVGGLTYRHQSFADLVRYSARHTVTAIDVDDVQAGWLDSIPIDYRREQGQPVIEQAFRAVRMDMLADAKAGRWLRHLDVMNELVAYRAVARGAELASLTDPSRIGAAEAAAKAYERRYVQLIREPKVPLAVSSGGGTVGTGSPLPLFRR